MNVILVSKKSARVRKITLTGMHFTLMIGAFLITVIVLALSLNYLSLRYAEKIDEPFLRALLVSPQEERHQKDQEHLHNNLNIMAAELGKMQAKLLRLDALGARLAESAGIEPQDFLFSELPGQGGAHTDHHSKSMGFKEFEERLHEFSYVLDERNESLGMIDKLLRGDRLTKSVLPSSMPIDRDWYSSGYGYRIDPFSGKKSFHRGVDFAATVGTPIKAAAGGVVVYSDRHRDYGNMVEIDHGDDFISRYAHASKLLVKLGQVVVQGQTIAEVGSTGRSTGPHLHFEIWHKGKPQNPSLFLDRPG